MSDTFRTHQSYTERIHDNLKSLLPVPPSSPNYYYALLNDGTSTPITVPITFGPNLFPVGAVFFDSGDISPSGTSALTAWTVITSGLYEIEFVGTFSYQLANNGIDINAIAECTVNPNINGSPPLFNQSITGPAFFHVAYNIAFPGANVSEVYSQTMKHIVSLTSGDTISLDFI